MIWMLLRLLWLSPLFLFLGEREPTQRTFLPSHIRTYHHLASSSLGKGTHPGDLLSSISMPPYTYCLGCILCRLLWLSHSFPSFLTQWIQKRTSHSLHLHMKNLPWPSSVQTPLYQDYHTLLFGMDTDDPTLIVISLPLSWEGNYLLPLHLNVDAKTYLD